MNGGLYVCMCIAVCHIKADRGKWPYSQSAASTALCIHFEKAAGLNELVVLMVKRGGGYQMTTQIDQ
jgi:hypothetical protein